MRRLIGSRRHEEKKDDLRHEKGGAEIAPTRRAKMGIWGVVCTTAAFVVVATERVVIYLLRVVSMQERRTRESRKGRKKRRGTGAGTFQMFIRQLIMCPGCSAVVLGTDPSARPPPSVRRGALGCCSVGHYN